jgi:methionine-rich copper-binding protein CopC
MKNSGSEVMINLKDDLMQQSRSKQVILIVCLPVLLLISVLRINTELVYAHARYDRSDPPADAVLPEAPTEVHIWFTQELFRREGANNVEVYGPDGTRVDRQDARIDDDDRTHMIVSLQGDLPTGTYTVHWKTLSAEDGDDESGEFSFTVSPPAESTMPTDDTLSPDKSATPGATTVPTDTPMPTVPPTDTLTQESQVSPTPAPSPTLVPQRGGWPCLSGILMGGLVAVAVLWRRQ